MRRIILLFQGYLKGRVGKNQNQSQRGEEGAGRKKRGVVGGRKGEKN